MYFDFQRTQLMNDIKQKLIELNHVILDFGENEDTYCTDYEIITDKNTIVLSLKMFYENGNCLFDEMSIYDYDGNHLLFEALFNDKHTLIEIYEIFLSHFTSSVI
jgi:hypothetical protein